MLLATLATAVTPLAAQSAAVGARFGTTGLSVEAAARFNPKLAVRGGVSFFSWSFRHRASSVSFTADLDFKAKYGVLDFYPGGGSFHLSGGVTTAPVEITGVGRPNFGGSYIFNGRQYNAAAVGDVAGAATWPDLSPYLGLGWGGAGPGETVGLTFDIGVAIGKPTFVMSAENATAGSQLEADVNAERDEIQAELDKYAKVYPMISMGIVVRF
jgi:hypothetical protein